MKVPGIGEFEKDDALGWYFGPAKAIPVLGGKKCTLVFDGYDGDERPEDFHAAATNFFSIGPEVLKKAEPFVYRYYQDCEADGGGPVKIASPADVWHHVQFGSEPQVTRRAYGDMRVYVSVECNCDWEREHGMQLVFEDGLVVSKVSAYDGHLTNEDAYDERSYDNVVYVDRAALMKLIATRKAKR